MENKEKFFQALKANNGHLEEIELGESINIDEESTRKIISELLSEYKIEFIKHGACNYRIPTKKTK
jgi:hypothetical protein